MTIDVRGATPAFSCRVIRLRAFQPGSVRILQILCVWASLHFATATRAQTLPHSSSRRTGFEVAAYVRSLDRTNREDVLVGKILDGNAPDSWRRFVEVTVTRTNEGSVHRLTMAVAPDYLTAGCAVAQTGF